MTMSSGCITGKRFLSLIHTVGHIFSFFTYGYLSIFSSTSPIKYLIHVSKHDGDSHLLLFYFRKDSYSIILLQFQYQHNKSAIRNINLDYITRKLTICYILSIKKLKCPRYVLVG